MNKRNILIASLVIFCSVLMGCGNSAVIMTPDYNKFIDPSDRFKRDNIRIDTVIDRRSTPSNQIGTAQVGMLNQEVPYLLTISANKFVKTALDKLIVKETSEKPQFPIIVFIDSLEVGEESTVFSGEIGYFDCHLLFAYQHSKDSIECKSSKVKKSKTSIIDITNSLEGLVYEGINECAKDFIENYWDKEAIRYTESMDSLLRSEMIEEAIHGIKIEYAKDVSPSSKDLKKIEKYIPPPNDPSIIFEGGFGIGLPYGALGFRGSVGNSLIMGEFGIGDYPVSPKTCFSIGGSVHFLDRYNWIHPKVTCTYSSHAATLAYELTDQQDKVVEEISESFNGIGIYAGCDIRFASDGNWFLDLNAGWRFPFVGNSGVEKRDNEILQDLKNRGYELEDKSKAWKNLTISLGLNYVIGRSLMLVTER